MIGTSENQSDREEDFEVEGPVARAIETKTSRIPSDIFLWGALGSIIASAVLQTYGKRKVSLFVGQWVSPMLLLGIYNKIVKVAGHDRASNSRANGRM